MWAYSIDSKMTAFDLDRLIDEFQRSLERLDSKGGDTRELWNRQKEISESFREVRFPTREEHQKSWVRFQGLIGTLKEKQDRIRQENEKFAEEVSRRLDQFEKSIGGGLFSPQHKKEDFTRLLEEQNAVYQLIQERRWPSKVARDEAWDRYTKLRGKLRKQQDDFYAQAQQKWNQRQQHSKQLREKILGMIEACTPESPIERLLEEMGEFMLFVMTLGLSAILSSLLGGDKNQKPENPLKQKTRALGDIRKYIKDNSERLTKEDKDAIYGRLNQVQDRLNGAWEAHKQEVDRKQRAFCSKVEQNLANQIAFLDKLRHREGSQRDWIRKLEGIRDNQRDFLGKLRDQLDDLREKRSDSSNSSNYRERVSGWINEKESKINEVESGIDGLNGKIRDAERQLDDLPSKIRELEAGIEDLRKKVDSCRRR
jgi:uncharacterized phage infection (PIP) family protein YhgE